jgi:hypothetical protein
MTILDGGFVGIGTATPQSALHVIGSASVSSNLVVSGNITATGLLTASNLRVLGDYVILDTISSNTEQMVITNDGTGPALKVTQTGANSIAEFYDDGNALAFKVANDGLIGIGTATPQAKLHVVGSVKATTSISSDTQFLGQATDTASTPSFSFAANPNTGIFQPTPSNLAVTTGGVERMRVLANGNVGIGTTNPVEKLHVQGNILSSGSSSTGTQFLGIATDTVAAPSYSWTGDSNTGMYHPGADKLGLVTAGVERVSVLDNGNVGIGTTNPGDHLYVNTGNSSIYGIVIDRMSTSSSLRQKGILIKTGTPNALGNGDGVIRVDNSDRTTFLLENNGNVGIGTTNPQAKLHVNGTFFCPGMIIQAEYYINNNVSAVIGSTTNMTDYATGISVTIVPRFVTSKIKVTLNCTFGITYQGKFYDRYLTRNGTKVTVGTYGWGRQYGSTSQVEHCSHSIFIDTPNSVSSLVYAVTLSGTGGHLAYSGSTVTLIAEEIAQ